MLGGRKIKNRKQNPGPSISLENGILHSNAAWEVKTHSEVKAVVFSPQNKVYLFISSLKKTAPKVQAGARALESELILYQGCHGQA